MHSTLAYYVSWMKLKWTCQLWTSLYLISTASFFAAFFSNMQKKELAGDWIRGYFEPHPTFIVSFRSEMLQVWYNHTSNLLAVALTNSVQAFYQKSTTIVLYPDIHTFLCERVSGVLNETTMLGACNTLRCSSKKYSYVMPTQFRYDSWYSQPKNLLKRCCYVSIETNVPTQSWCCSQICLGYSYPILLLPNPQQLVTSAYLVFDTTELQCR